jgi:hypothetical protein
MFVPCTKNNKSDSTLSNFGLLAELQHGAAVLKKPNLLLLLYVH